MEKVHRRKSTREGLREKVFQRRSAEEGPLEKVRRRRSAREIPSEKVHWRRSTREGPSEKRDIDGRGSVKKWVVAGKVALIPCEEKNSSLIFIN